MFKYIIGLLILFGSSFLLYCSDSDSDSEINDLYLIKRATHTIQKSDGSPLELIDKTPIPKVFQKCFKLLDDLQTPGLTLGIGAKIIDDYFEPDLDRSDLTRLPIPLSDFGKWYDEPNPINLQCVVNFSDEIIAERKRLSILIKSVADENQSGLQIKAAFKAFSSLEAELRLTILPDHDHDIDLIAGAPLGNLMRFIDSIAYFTEADLAKIIPIDLYKIIFMVSIRPFIHELGYFTHESNGFYVDIEKDRDLPFLDIFNRACVERRKINCGTKYFAFVNFMLSKNDDANYKYVKFF